MRHRRFPFAALLAVLLLAWLNFLLTERWAAFPGALNGWRQPWYAAALLASTVLTLATWRHIGTPVTIGRFVPLGVLGAGAAVLVAAMFSRLPLSTIWPSCSSAARPSRTSSSS